MRKSLVKAALRIAIRKLSGHPELANFLHYSFVVRDNQIVEWATNARQEPPRHYGYHRRCDASFRPKFHSEVRAYRRARGLIGTGADFEMINIRLTRSGLVR